MKRPTFSVTLTKPLSTISLAIHVCARASVAHTHVHMHGQSNMARFPPKQWANSAWKPRWEEGYSFASTGHFPWQLHPDVSQSEETRVAHWPNGGDHPGAVTDKETGCGGLKSCLLWYFSCQTEPKKKPLKIQSNVKCTYFGVTQLLSPEINGTWSGSTKHVRRVEADITANRRLSPQASWVIYSLIQSQLLFILSPVT